jgi:hypothetical protein
VAKKLSYDDAAYQPGVEVLSYKELLPRVYLDKSSTPLSASIKKGKNLELNFAIETK